MNITNSTYQQPFYVGLNNPRFPYARNGYLPALELPEPEQIPVVKLKTATICQVTRPIHKKVVKKNMLKVIET